MKTLLDQFYQVVKMTSRNSIMTFRRFLRTDNFHRQPELTTRQRDLMSRGLPKKLPMVGVRKTILISSAKGGVGKSTTTVNLALATANHHSSPKVGILDADVFGPSIPKLMRLSGNPELTDDNLMEPLINYGVKCMSMGFLVDENDPVVWRGPMVMSAIQKLSRQVNWSPLDYLFIDMPPGTGDTHLSISQTMQVDGAVVVTTPQDIALLDARRGAEMFKKVGIPLLGLVQNMSHFVCPNCLHVSHIFGEDGAVTLSEEINAPLLGNIPLDVRIREHADKGYPIIVSHPDSLQSKAYKEISEKILLSVPV